MAKLYAKWTASDRNLIRNDMRRESDELIRVFLAKNEVVLCSINDLGVFCRDVCINIDGKMNIVQRFRIAFHSNIYDLCGLIDKVHGGTTPIIEDITIWL